MPRWLRAMGRAGASIGRAIGTHAGIGHSSARRAILEHWDTDRLGLGRRSDGSGWRP